MQKISAEVPTAELDTLRHLVNGYFQETEQPIFSFLSGSIAEGIATPNSDYDVYAVFENCEEEEVLISDLQRPVELTKISLSKIYKIMEFVLNGDDLASVSNYEMLICHRVYSGITLSGEIELDVVKRKFDVATFKRRLADLSLHKAEHELKVSNGFKSVNDIRSAVFSAQRALKQSLIVLLAIRGSTSILEKWQVSYGAACLGEDNIAFRRFLELASCAPISSTAQSINYINSVKKFHQMVTDYKIVADFIPEESFFVDTRLVDADILNEEPLVLKNPDARVIFHKSSWYLMVADKAILELPQLAAYFWALINNAQSPFAVIDNAKEHLSITSDTCYEYLDALAAAKAISFRSYELQKI